MSEYNQNRYKIFNELIKNILKIKNRNGYIITGT